ncbi:MAG: GGDEF domain-containing protein [Oscillospiraceae bacterium]
MNFEDLLEEFNANLFYSVRQSPIVTKMIKYAKDLNDDFLLGRAYTYKAQLEYYSDNLEKSDRYARKALKLLELFPPTIEIIYANNLLGIITDLKGNIVASIDYYIDAIRYSEQTGIHNLLALIYNNIGSIHKDIYDYDNAIRFLRRGIREIKNRPGESPRALLYIYANLSLCYNGLNDLPSLEKLYSKWCQLSFESSKEVKKCNINLTICRMFIEMRKNQREDARRSFEEFIVDIKANFDADLLKDLLRTVEFWINMDYTDEAEEFLKLCGTLIYDYKVNNLEREYYYSLIQLANKLHDETLKQSMIIKYYEVGEIERKNLQKINAENLRDKVSMFEMEKKIANSELDSMTDTLTKLYNRRAFNNVISAKFDVACKTNQSVAIAFFDVDNFKQYNDSNGHLEGDNCLQFIAEETKKLCDNDMIALRYGGDEFLMMFFGKEEDEVYSIVQNLHNIVQSKNLKNPNSRIGVVTISTGICIENVETNSDIYSLIIKADRALYKSKETKNTIQMAQPLDV